MIIYDFSHQQTVNYSELGIGLFFLLLGLLLFFIFSKYAPKFTEDFSTKLLGLTKSNLEKRSELIPSMFKAIGVILILGASTMLYYQSKNIFYVKNIHQFEDIKTMECKIDSILTTTIFGTNYITIYTDNKTFNIERDDKYISHRNLLQNDSITIEYFEENVKNEPLDLKDTIVLKIELIPTQNK